MHTITLNKDVYTAASGWNELTGDQLLKVADMMNDVTNLNEFLIKLWLEMLDFKVVREQEVIIENQVYFYLWSKTKEFKTPTLTGEAAYHYYSAIKDKVYLISATDLQFAASHLKWMFSEKLEGQNLLENTFVMQSKLTKNLISEIEFKNKSYCGPADALTNLIFEEYIFAETYFSRYQSTKDRHWLDMFFAVLYRPVKSEKEINANDYNGDKRIAFNSAQTERRALELVGLPMKYKNASLLFYEGSRNYLAHKFPLTFKPGGGGSKEDIFVSLNKLTVTIKNETNDSLESIRQSLLYDILEILEDITRKQNLKNKKK